MPATFCLVANCPSCNDNQPTIHSGNPSASRSSIQPQQQTGISFLVCPQALGSGPHAVLCGRNWHNLPYRRPVELVRSEYLGREIYSAPTSHSERWGIAHERGDLRRHSKAVFGAPSCRRSQSALPTQLAFASNNSNNYSGTRSRCTRIRGR